VPAYPQIEWDGSDLSLCLAQSLAFESVEVPMFANPVFSKMMDAMFGCRHARYSFPITVRAGSRRAPAAQRSGTYVACLDCGREFRYDWQEMKIVGSQPREAAHSLVTKEAA
jgi:hypothetical protein